MDEVHLVGFVHQYGKDDFSIWGVNLSDEDETAIMEILQKYSAEGISVRGDLHTELSEVYI